MKSTNLLVGLAFCFVTGCSTVEEASEKMKADPAPDSGFLTAPEKMAENRDRYPFNRVWISPTLKQNRDSYRKIVISPVNVAHLQQMSWWQQQSAVSQESLRKDAKEIASYIRKTFSDAVLKDPNRRFMLTNVPGENTLIFETALVELVPAKAFFNAAATVGGFFVPGAGYATMAGKGSVAIEMRVRDGKTGAVLAQMADRELGKSALVDVAGMTWYDSSKNIIVDWANQFIALANTDPNTKVADSSPFELVTW